MREFTTPGALTLASDDNVVAALFERAGRQAQAPAFARRQGTTFIPITLGAFAEQVRSIAAGFIGLGIEPGSAICLFSRTRYEFTVVDYAILAAGCLTVPIYETDSPEQVRWAASNSGAVAIVVETAELEKAVAAVADQLPALKHVFVIEASGLAELAAHGSGISPAEADARWQQLGHDQLASIVYTSGTTGLPKGCMLTHGNFIYEVRAIMAVEGELLTPDSATLMFLPLAHVLARVVQFACVTAGVQLGYATDIKHLTEELRMFPPTWIFSVPRVFEKVFAGARAQAGGGMKVKIFDRAAAVAIAMSEQRQAGRTSWLTKGEFALYDRLVYRRLREAMGGRVRWAISGGAPLRLRLGHFYDGLGLRVLEGYGLTETTAAATCNTPSHLRVGTVGRPLPGVSVRIADDGEVLLRGPVVFTGYFQNPQATGDALEPDGWFHTGDLGALDANGFLSITGRKKDLIITAGGKNVQPAELEEALQANPLVAQAIVIGDGKPFIAALVTLDREELPGLAKQLGHPVLPADQLVTSMATDPQVHASIQKTVDTANELVSRAESIREFRILSEELSVDGGELTATLKVKRAVVMTKFAGVVSSIYGDG